MEASGASQGQISARRLETRAAQTRNRRGSGISRGTSGASIKAQGLPAMSELTPQHVLTDLFGSGDFPAEVLDPAQAAEIVVQRLLDAGFEIKAQEPRS
jgi:hypothetical protein